MHMVGYGQITSLLVIFVGILPLLVRQISIAKVKLVVNFNYSFMVAMLWWFLQFAKTIAILSSILISVPLYLNCGFRPRECDVYKVGIWAFSNNIII